MVLLFFQWVTYLLGTFSILCLVVVGLTGYYTRRDGRRHPVVMELHEACVDVLLIITLGILIIVEVFRVFLPQMSHHPPIFRLHLGFAIPFLVSLVAIRGIKRFGINGVRFPRFHKFLAYPCLGFGMGANILGMYMAYILH